MLEVEMKFPVTDFQALERLLASWNAHAGRPCASADHYFNAPDRDFAVTDEALRVRRDGATARVTYKGPKRDTVAKIRTEIEVSLADGDNAAIEFMKLLEHLGYRPVLVVRKNRQPFHLRRDGYEMEVCLDEVPELGRFVEVEILAPEAELDRANQVLTAAVKELGLGGAERRSYLEMLLLKKEGDRRS
jgi:adenylate cyclase class 2